MVREEPFFKKCCWCIPLKICLQVWAGVKSIVDLALLGFLIMLVMLLDQYHELSGGLSLGHGLIIYIIILILDCIFMVVLTVGICTNKLRTLQVYFYYNIYMALVSGTTLLVFVISSIVSDFYHGYFVEYIIIVFFLMINFGVDICIIYTLKSEIIKIRNKQQFGFVKLSSLTQNAEVERSGPAPSEENAVEINLQ